MTAQGADHADVIFYSEGPVRARYISGLTMYEESMFWGRWIGRYWTGVGYVELDGNLGWVEHAAHTPARTAGLDMAAFGLEIDGQSLHFGWELTKMSEASGGRPGNKRALVELRSSLRPITLEVHTEADGTGFLSRWLRITNTGDRPVALGAVWPWSGLLSRVEDWRALVGRRDGPIFTVGHMAQRIWSNEGAFDWQPLPSTRLCLEGRTGKSGHGTPFFVVHNRATGQYIVGGLAWSGNWAIELTAEQLADPDALLAFRIGPTNPTPQRVIAAGETVETPQVHVGMLQMDFDGAIQAWHRHLRRSVLPPQIPGRESLVFYNSWSYRFEELTEEELRFEIDVAAEVGAEVFTIDAGWFGNKGSDFFKVVGDWECGDRLPNGLEPVVAYARQKGLLVSMWFDLEHLGSESDVVCEHPDWVVKRYGTLGPTIGPAPTGRDTHPTWLLDHYRLAVDYRVADLSNPEVVDYLERKAVGIIERYSLDVFRIDFNIQPYEEGQVLRDGHMENTVWRHYEAAYALYDRIRRRFPNLIMENCSGGGGRTDLGLAGRFHHNLLTDWQLAPRTARIINGMTMALPPERVDRMVGVSGAAVMRGDLDFHFRSAMLGHLTLSGIYPGPRERNPQHVARIRHHVDVYKRHIRPLLPTCRVYHHTPVLKGEEPQGWAVLEYVSEDSSRAVLAVFRLAGAGPDTYRLRLRGLDAGRRYRVTCDNTGQSLERDGATLKHRGLLVCLPEPLSSELLILEEVD